MSQPELAPPEFPRPLPLAGIGPAGRSQHIEAKPAECAALAKRFGILGLDRLIAELELTPEPDGAVRMEGRIRASLTQACVVSGEPVAETIDTPILLRLLPPGREPQDGPDDPDEIECPDGVADLGEAVAEQLALALDPYPRAPTAELPAEAGGAVTGGFAALAGLRRRH